MLNAPLLGLLAMLYFAQGLPSGLLGKALPPLLRQQGISLSTIGFTALLALPWTMKFLWAPFLDRFWTRRRWLLTLNLIMFILMILLASRDFGYWVSHLFPFLMILLFLMNITAATKHCNGPGGKQISATYARSRQQRSGDRLQVGMIFGGGACFCGWVAAGWQLSYTALAFLIIPILLPVWFMREPETPVRSEPNHVHGKAGRDI